MKQEIKARYPAPAAAVIKMFSDPAFHEQKLKALGIARFQVLASSKKGDEFSIRIERKVPVDLPVPGMKGVEATAVHEERWNAATKSGRVEVDAKGVPATIACQAKFADDADGCTLTYTWTIESRVPLVGGKIEKAIASDMVKMSAPETQVGVERVDEYR
ncbi:MAG TPA: DUF2505 domain-containing protein [Nevskiaceae bacterium]|nr:DUF2505 domain-containing protein [Nevskiaceae bacterium]